MKKTIFAVIVALSLLLTACGSTTTELAVLEYEKEDVAFEEYDNNLEGMEEYFEDKNLIAGNASEMSYDFISAIDGQKYFYSVDEVGISCEIYEYDLENMDDRANEIVNSIKENGFFISLDTEIKATLSDSGKYIMIVGGDYTNENAIDYMNDLNESFKGFYA